MLVSNRHLIAVLLLTLLATATARSQPFEHRTVVEGLEIPWEILWGPDDRIWVTERPGRVSRIDPETGARRQLLRLANPFDLAEIGMLGMALHPRFEETPYVYIVDAYVRDGEILERVTRYLYDPRRDTLWRDEELLDSIQAGISHGGSRLAIGPDSMLYITVGDKGSNALDAVDHTKIFGKTLRMTLDGRVPADNPWPHYQWPQSLIWTTGHRNSQGLAFGPDGTLYASEHGPHLVDDEVNILKRGRNYGWPHVQGLCDGVHDENEGAYCADSNVVEPIRAFTPSVAPAGLEYYDHLLIDEWRGSLLMASMGLVSPTPDNPTLSLLQLKLDASGASVEEMVPWFVGEFGRIRDLCVAPDGRVFIATSNRDGRHWPSYERYASDRIIEIRPPADTTWVAATTLSGLQFCAGDSLSVGFAAGGRFRAGNRFVVELSDATGSFARPLVVGSTTPIGGTLDSLGGILPIAIPDSLGSGDSYAMRLVSTRPASPVAPLASGLRIGERPRPVLRDSVGVLRAASGYRIYRWHVGDADIADADTATWIPRRSGRYWVEVVDSLGCIGTSNIVEVLVSGVPLPALATTSVRVMPQPMRDRLVVELDVERPGRVELVVSNAAGAVVRELTREASAGTLRIEIPVESLEPGLYLVDLRTPAGRWSGKVVRE